MSENLPSIYEYDYDVGDAAQPQPLPVGEYRATVKQVESQRSKSSGNQMAVVDYLVTADQYPADYTDGNPDGTTLRVYVVTDPAVINTNPLSRWKLRQFAEMHGVKIGKRLNVPDFIGQEVILNVTHEDYQGNPQARGQPIRSA